jgi:hypothetical protein
MHEASPTEIVFPHLAGLVVEGVEAVDDVVQIRVRSRSTGMACHRCSTRRIFLSADVDVATAT